VWGIMKQRYAGRRKQMAENRAGYFFAAPGILGLFDFYGGTDAGELLL